MADAVLSGGVAAAGASAAVVVSAAPSASVASAAAPGSASGGLQPMPELADLIDRLAGPGALAELAALAACLGLAWLAVKALRRRLDIDGAVLFGRRLVDGVLFPLVALLLALLARLALRPWVAGAVFKVAVPVLLSLALIRLTARVLAAALPGRGWARFVEHTVSWLAWIAVVLWIGGVLPVALARMDELTWKIGAAEVSLRSMFEGAVTAGVVMVLALWLSAVVEKRLIRGSGDSLSLRMMAANLVRAALLGVGLLVALSSVGIDLTALSVLGGAVGVGVGLGLQKIAANYVSGFVILAERSLRIGDMVKVDGFEGRVTSIRTRYTAIRALNGRESIVPNELLITQRVENASLGDSRIALTAPLQVAYGSDLDALLPALAAVVGAVPRVLADPPPAVLLKGFAPDGVDLLINFWIGDPHAGNDNVRSAVNLAALRCLQEHGVQIPFPQRMLHGAAAAPGSGHEPAPGAPAPSHPALDNSDAAARAVPADVLPPTARHP